MKEMDVLLERFLEREYDALPPDQQSAFERLLDEADPDLYAWITGQNRPAEPAYLDLVRRLQTLHK